MNLPEEKTFLPDLPAFYMPLHGRISQAGHLFGLAIESLTGCSMGLVGWLPASPRFAGADAYTGCG